MSSIHASCVAFGDVGVLIRGAPGAGKSSLCLLLMDGPSFGLGEMPLRAKLVADDQVQLLAAGGALLASAPAALAGKLEIRGLGLVDVAWQREVALRLVVDLVPGSQVTRLPEAHDSATALLGITLPRLALGGELAIAAARLRAALGHFHLV